MKKQICMVLSLLLLFIMEGCGNRVAEGGQGNISPESEAQTERRQNINHKGASAETEDGELSEAVSGRSQKAEQQTDMDDKILVVYFSATGTTKPLAEYAAEILNADIYEIVPEEPYTEADLAYYTNCRADQEQNDPSARPEISGSVENMEDYDIIVLGYPIWHGQAPRIISTFLESYDFSGKTVIPFCTSHSSGIGSSADNLHSLCPDSTVWAEGRRFEAETSRSTIEEWLDRMNQI